MPIHDSPIKTDMCNPTIVYFCYSSFTSLYLSISVHVLQCYFIYIAQVQALYHVTLSLLVGNMMCTIFFMHQIIYCHIIINSGLYQIVSSKWIIYYTFFYMGVEECMCFYTFKIYTTIRDCSLTLLCCHNSTF